jgi:cysteine-rich repeat protein
VAETCTGAGASCPSDDLLDGVPCLDGDSFDDDVEVAGGTDPTNPLSFPGSAVCGNSVVEGAEQCDDGNTNNGDCCSSTCFFESAATVCRSSAGTCDVEETCTGSSDTCPADGFESAATECRASADVCDVAETCSGSGASCPADGFESAATECRASADVCDVAETCTGSGANCPVDGFESAATQCRTSADVCDVAETCTGAGASCPSDDLLDGVPCLDGDMCNGAEECAVGVCQPMAPLNCDDADACTADSCDEVTGCANDPIDSPECTVIGVPANSEWSLLLTVVLMTAVGGVLIEHRRRRRSI